MAKAKPNKKIKLTLNNVLIEHLIQLVTELENRVIRLEQVQKPRTLPRTYPDHLREDTWD